jgi:hypothetical protein
MAKPVLDVYLDQSVYSRMVAESGREWGKSAVGSVVSEAQQAKKALVWVHPTHVIETVQASDLALRRDIASVMLDITECRRMGYGHEAETVSEFFDFLEQFAPGSVNRVYYKYHADLSRHIYLGALAFVAFNGATQRSDVIDRLKRHKTVNRLLHARWAADPDNWVARMIDAVEQYKTVPESTLEDFSTRSIEDLEVEIANLELAVRSIATRTRMKLDQNRAQIARTYGAVEVGKYLTWFLPLPMELELTFSFPRIIAAWPSLISKTGAPSLPKEVVMASPQEQVCSTVVTTGVLRAAIQAAASAGLMTTYIGFEVILRELQRMANNGEVPKGSLTFDADHAGALKRFDVVMTHDVGLAASLRTMAGSLTRMTRGTWSPAVCEDAAQLRKLLSL